MKIADYFRPDGLISRVLPGYEFRQGQLDVAEAVHAVLRDGGTLMAEAGTGIGKSFAYLVPAFLCGHRVVVSTATKTLQDQLCNVDLPRIAEILGPDFDDVHYTQLKGRENYLCALRWAEFHEARDGTLPGAHSRNIDAVATWLETTETGDRDEISGIEGDLDFWNGICASKTNRIGLKCSEHPNCFLSQARTAATRADIVIVNHSLLIADRRLRELDDNPGLLGEYDRLIVDEAHRLEDFATSAMETEMSLTSAKGIREAATRYLKRYSGVEIDAVEMLSRVFVTLFQHLTKGDNQKDRQFDLSEPVLKCVEEAAGHLGVIEEKIQTIVGQSSGDPSAATAKDVAGAGNRVATAGADVDDAFWEGQKILTQIGDFREDLRGLFERRPGHVYWTSWRGDGAFAHATPVHPADELRTHLFEDMEATVLTSATLKVDRSFDFVKENVGIEGAQEVVRPAPFDFERSRLYLPRDMPDPQWPDLGAWRAEAISRIRTLAAASRGRALVLCTTSEMVKTMADALRDAPFHVLAQGAAGRDQLLREFRETPKAVLLATRSFWEGVDISGRALSLLIVDRLPFSPISNPLVKARMDRAEQHAGGGFDGYLLPQAVLTLKQGIGRLIRRGDDVGLVAVLDSRLTDPKRTYGKTFLEPLPKFKQIHELAEAEEFLRKLP